MASAEEASASVLAPTVLEPVPTPFGPPSSSNLAITYVSQSVIYPRLIFDNFFSADVTATAIQSSPKRKFDSTLGSSAQPVAKKTKATYQRAEDRKAVLEANSHISAVEPHRVRCQGCSKWIALASKKEYKLANWEAHEGKCPGITGTKVVRTRAKKTHQVVRCDA